MRLRFMITLLIPLCSFCASSASALESLSLIITEAGSQAFTEETPGQLPLVPQAGHIIVRGHLDPPGLRLPTINHVGLYSQQGQSIPLWIDSTSLVFAGDRISALRLAFEVPLPTDPAPLFKLVWSEEPAPLASNLSVPGLAVANATQAGRKTFVLKPGVTGPVDVFSTIVIEVDPRQRVYQAWYLLPVLLILGLAALRRYWLQGKNEI